MSILKTQRITKLEFEVTWCHLTFNVLRFELRNCFPNSHGSGVFVTCDFYYKTYLECIYLTYGVFKRLKYFSREALQDGTDVRNTGQRWFLDSYLQKKKTNSLFFFQNKDLKKKFLLFLLEIQWEYEVFTKIAHCGTLFVASLFC